MARLRFTLGTRYRRHGAVFLVRDTLANARVVVENLTSGGQEVTPIHDLVTAWTVGALVFEGPGLRAGADNLEWTPEPLTRADLQSVASSQRDEAWRRYTLIQPLLALPASAWARPALAAYAATARGDDGAPVSRGSLERWLRAFVESGYDIRALVPATDRSGARGFSRLSPEVETIVRAVLAACAAAPRYRTGSDVYLLVLARVADANQGRAPADQLPPPSLRTIYRHITRAGTPGIVRRLSRGERQALRPVGVGPAPTRVLERVEIDHTVLDVILVDGEDRRPIGRPTLTLALDVHSGFPLGCYVGFEPPSYRTVQSCLLHAILPKEDVRARYGTQHPWPTYGLPETLVVDNGPEFVGRDLDDACAQLGITLERTPVRQPWYKGSIERYFGTHNTGLVHTLPGATGPTGGDDPSGQACLTLDAFWRVLHVFLLDIYAERFHTGLNGIPARRWDQGIAAAAPPCLPVSAADLRILLGRCAARAVRRTGIAFACLRYQSPDLTPLRQRLGGAATARIKYDPADLGTLYVFDAEPPGRWLHVPAIDQAYARGLSLWAHRVIRAQVLRERGRVDMSALAAAKAQIEEVVQREYAQTRRQRRRKAAARFLGRERAGDGPSSLDDPMPPTAAESVGGSRMSLDDLVAGWDMAACLSQPGWGVDYELPRDHDRGPRR